MNTYNDAMNQRHMLWMCSYNLEKTLFFSFRYQSSSPYKMHSTDKAAGTVVERNWPTQLFYATLMKTLISYSIFITKKTFTSYTTWKSSVEKYWTYWTWKCASYPSISRRSSTYAKLSHWEKEPQNNKDVTSKMGNFL